ncbi:hypothetical protein QAD02_009046 [Eretmocerus hayati]|uniref:Uncharacterized protein n=1 Tax=Eretmocerus hayati TaxID=131215 RepID=A0ACC2NAM3_9HYME|nr:hypothetical protein QAD02_009046 [Eretmocerus hayati]
MMYADGLSIIMDSISQVFLNYNKKFFCIATVISPKYVLTAARCLQHKDPKNITITSGSTDMKDSGHIHYVEKIIVHQYFILDTDFGIPTNNIALAKVTEPFRGEDNIEPIDLYRPEDVMDFDAGAEILSYGCYFNSTGLLISWVPSMNRDSCYTTYKEYGGLPDGSICVSTHEMGGCGGASGNPMIVNGRLAGIFSYKLNTCNDEMGYDCPAVHTGIQKYYGWIKKNAELDDGNPGSVIKSSVSKGSKDVEVFLRAKDGAF